LAKCCRNLTILPEIKIPTRKVGTNVRTEKLESLVARKANQARKGNRLHTATGTSEFPENTTEKWTIRCNTPVSSWEVLVPSDWGEQTAENKTGESDAETDKDAPKFRSILADLDEAGTTATFEIPVAKALKYSFRWTEKANGFQYEDVQYGVKVTTDGLPDVDLIEPREVGYATVGKVVKMEAKGTDDIGLDKAWLVYSLNGADETKVEIFNFEGDTNKTFNYSWKLADNLKELKPEAQLRLAMDLGKAAEGGVVV